MSRFARGHYRGKSYCGKIRNATPLTKSTCSLGDDPHLPTIPWVLEVPGVGDAARVPTPVWLACPCPLR